MIQRFKEIFDLETGKVVFAALLPGGLTMANVNTVVQFVIGVGTAIYIWRKVIRPNKRDEDDTET